MSDSELNTGSDGGCAICEHIKPGGERCGSPAWNGDRFCYYHSNVRRRVPKVNMMVYLSNPHPENNENYQCDMPYLEDPEAVQMAYTQLIHVLTQDRIRVDRARLVLSALHGASRNMRALERAARRRDAKFSPKKQPVAVRPEKASAARVG